VTETPDSSKTHHREIRAGGPKPSRIDLLGCFHRSDGSPKPLSDANARAVVRESAGAAEDGGGTWWPTRLPASERWI